MLRLLPFLALILVGCTSSAPVDTTKPTQPITGTNTPTIPDGTNLNRIFQTKDLLKVKLKTKNTTLDMWVMDTEDKRREGMMFLEDKDVKASEGMLFTFKEPQAHDGGRGFWMKNTIVPLDIVYVDRDMKVINIGAGKPFVEEPVLARGDFQYVVEVKAGLAMKYGLTPGSKIDIPKEAAAKD
jgi:uncharacterized protein